MKINHNKLRLLGAFLLGFTIWIPFLFLVLDLCPYHLIFTSEFFKPFSPSGCYGWGWERNKNEVYEGHIPEGTYQSSFSLICFYGVYFFIVVIVYVCTKHILYFKKVEVREVED